MHSNTRLNNKAHKLKVGQKVTTDFTEGEEEVIRTILYIEKNYNYGSKYVASVSAANQCLCCGRANGKTIIDVDAAWLIPVKKKKKK